jgi:chromate transporter
MMQTFWTLIVSFTVIGLGAYGGGLVTVPLMQHELVTTRGLMSMTQMSQLVALAQMTPGPIAVNGATFVGYNIAGLAGALLASIVVVLPGVLALVLLLFCREHLPVNTHSLRLRRGLRAGVLGLLLFATWSYSRGVIHSWVEGAIAAAAFAVLLTCEGRVHPLAVIVGAGVIGMLVF